MSSSQNLKAKAKKGGIVHPNERYESKRAAPSSSTSSTAGPSQAIVPYATASQSTQNDTMLVPKGYTVKPIVPAKEAELIAVAKAMHRDEFGTRVKELFDPEREAALDALQTGIYIGWRCPEFKWDCIRVGVKSKCFCGHLLAEHERFTGTSVRVPCSVAGCTCRAFAFIPSRPEDVGEFWLRKRRNFDPRTWRAKCRCKHNHEEHNTTASHKCNIAGCPCSGFDSNFLCAACDKHWEQHETFFETEQNRKDAGFPYGEAYLPFAEMPNLRNAVLSGNEEDDSAYRIITSGTDAYSRLGPSSNSARPALPPAKGTGGI
ncbi:protein FAM221B [Amblyraja radiata]|uniref:protein FAM221B n=1 Tax=Amblyraja radiata TaxID=386614 RepID=UPI0014038144|nr:protein FAM221B [Amblyraja radiata]